METKKSRIRGNKKAKYVFRVPNDDVLAQIGVGQGDLDIIEVYKRILGISRRAVLHEMVGVASRCMEENHPVVINKMAKQITGMKYLLHLYRAKYGALVEDKENDQKTNP